MDVLKKELKLKLVGGGNGNGMNTNLNSAETCGGGEWVSHVLADC